MDDKYLDIFETMEELFEETQTKVLTIVDDFLYSNLRNKNWRDIQLSSKQLTSLKQSLKKQASKSLKAINRATSRAFEMAKIKEPKGIVLTNKKNMGLLIGSARKHYKEATAKVWKVSSAETLHKDILDQISKGYDEGLRLNINGRSYEYKSYMQMKIRSNIASEATNNQLDLNEITKNVFALCNSFEDAATDHKELQGRIYYDNRYKKWNLPPDVLKEVERLIKNKNMMSIQEVIGKPYWLTTRPNCRHALTPITVEQAGGNVQELLKKMRLTTGKGSDRKYKLTQQLRYIERNIRKYKGLKSIYIDLMKKSPSKEVEAYIKHYDILIQKWEVRADNLVQNANSKGYRWLKRDARRETRQFITESQ